MLTAAWAHTPRGATWQGIHVITPNKKAGSGPYEYLARLRELGRSGAAHYFYETTVGA